MKRITKVALTAVASAMLAISGSALAATTSKNVTAKVKVQGSCVFDKHTTSATELNFGTVNTATVTVDPTATATVFYNCSKNVPYSVTVAGGNDSGANSFLKDAGGANSIQYSRTVTGSGAGQTGAGMGATQEKQVKIDGSIAVANLVNAASSGAGLDYTDVITVTVTY